MRGLRKEPIRCCRLHRLNDYSNLFKIHVNLRQHTRSTVLNLICSTKYNSTFLFNVHSVFEYSHQKWPSHLDIKKRCTTFPCYSLSWFVNYTKLKITLFCCLVVFMFKIADPFKRSCVTVDWKYEPIRLRTLKLLSLDADVTDNAMITLGKHRPISIRYRPTGLLYIWPLIFFGITAAGLCRDFTTCL